MASRISRRHGPTVWRRHLHLRCNARTSGAFIRSSGQLAAIVACWLAILISSPWPNPTGALASRPPRGYCTHISRAIAPSSLCYDHLIRDRYAARDSVTTGPTTSQASDASGTNVPPAASISKAAAGGGSLKNNVSCTIEGYHTRRKEEELVYVRLETVGGSIQDLNTQAINERLLRDVYRQLLQVVMPPRESKGDSSERLGAGGEGRRAGGDLEDVRAQILSPPPGTAEGQRLANKCLQSMEKFLCRMAYPSCHFRHKDVSALVRPPCREDCYLLRDVFCSNLDWPKFSRALVEAFNITLMSMINELDLASQGELALDSSRAGPNGDSLPMGTKPSRRQLNSSIHYYWPHEHSIQNCDSLPTIRSIHSRAHSAAESLTSLIGNTNVAHERPSQHADHQGALISTEALAHSQPARWPVCSDASLTRVPAPSVLRHNKMVRLKASQSQSTDCLASDDGIAYTGSRNYTKSGIPCQMWQDQTPHRHKESELLFENMRRAHSFCRNPGGLELKPWCYTQDAKVRWEYCDIKPC